MNKPKLVRNEEFDLIQSYVEEIKLYRNQIKVLEEENRKKSSLCVELNDQLYYLTQIIMSTYRLLIQDSDKFTDKILSEKDIEYIEKRNKSISNCFDMLNKALKECE